eukprot:TRINITY_DN41364_c0_g1_i1.p1 TRINITY_DN41364_c0_g1~~TRINITY_DN41364_c0_g1_i1.p1  ORF type:complete len:144 (+),score=13.62 TRINITY_DN41364_c0_g1_i1:63-434(+)
MISLASSRCVRWQASLPLMRAPYRPKLPNFSSKTAAEAKDPWVEVPDPLGSGKTYWWNQTTNQTTHVGAPHPARGPSVLDRMKAFKDAVAHDINNKQRRRVYFFGDGGYYGGGGDGGGGGGGG